MPDQKALLRLLMPCANPETVPTQGLSVVQSLPTKLIRLALHYDH